MSGPYFFLNTETIVVEGKQNAAIYDLISGDIIGLEPEMAMILRLTEEGLTMEQVAFRLSKEVSFVQTTLERIAARALGKFYRTRVYIEKSKEGKPTRGEIFTQAPVITQLVVELPYQCGLECSFCQTLKINACAMCSKAKGEYPNSGDLSTFLSRLLKMQCMSLVFRGGDPLTQQDEFFELVGFCRKLGFDGHIYVITNGTCIDGKVIKYLQLYGIHPVIPFAGENGYLISERSLRHLGQVFRESQIGFTLTVLNSLNNAGNTEHIREFAAQLGATNILQTTIVDDLEGGRHEFIRNAARRQILRVSAPVFHYNSEYHPCLYGSLAVSADGRILPCPFLVDEALGTIADPLAVDKIFEAGLIEKYWQLSLSHIEQCRDCALRHGCLDCRAIEKSLTANLYGKRICSLQILP